MTQRFVWPLLGNTVVLLINEKNLFTFIYWLCSDHQCVSSYTDQLYVNLSHGECRFISLLFVCPYGSLEELLLRIWIVVLKPIIRWDQVVMLMVAAEILKGTWIFVNSVWAYAISITWWCWSNKPLKSSCSSLIQCLLP